eukprot:CAMPEP_0181179744 /NCGR_PEP_ID=MMETSP1096-20121128/6426_1 /TAXON_ID=156174 ORGANISM="Chrysochromulina ericina, Strain CCMP281" /NCGR_SAMPLE_ID=MMETSP1096 /ASSEMBLY_ACC=CAM_ASM_000453 /LENGTH=73 /DNA_ID=CAMNT_0023268119 /DNA_START=1009 /DNA_END=1230 /DNA_ORIENTATION=-
MPAPSAASLAKSRNLCSPAQSTARRPHFTITMLNDLRLPVIWRSWHPLHEIREGRMVANLVESDRWPSSMHEV